MYKKYEIMHSEYESLYYNQFSTLCPLLATFKVLKINLGTVGVSDEAKVRVLQICAIGSRDPEDKFIIGSQNPSINNPKGLWWEWE